MEERVPRAFGSTPFLEPIVLTPPEGLCFPGDSSCQLWLGDSPCLISQCKPTSPAHVSASVKMVLERHSQSQGWRHGRHGLLSPFLTTKRPQLLQAT